MTNDSSILKPQTFVLNLPGIEKVRREYAQALDSFLFEWAESMLPYYEEFIRRDADVFECQNVSTFGKDWAECYDHDGIHYRFEKTPLWGGTLSLDGRAGYTELNWRSCFWNKYPQYHGAMVENFSDSMFFDHYFCRYPKKDPKYLIVTDRLRDYFKYLTSDADIVFDVGWYSFIYRDARIRRIIERNPSMYY